MPGVEYLWVGLGGLSGAILRFAVGRFAVERFGGGFPYGTLFVNVSGSLAIGVLFTLLVGRVADPAWRLLLITGFLGGFTTFSAYTFEAVTLIDDGRWQRAAVYLIGSNLLALIVCAAGITLGRALTR